MENQDSSNSKQSSSDNSTNPTTPNSFHDNEVIRTLRESANQPVGPETIHIRRAGSGPPPPVTQEELPEPISIETARTRASYVRTMITKIERYLNQGKTKEEIEKMPHIPEFKAKFSKLYDTVMTPGYDKQSLYTMLTLLEKMGRAEMSQHDASVIVGQRLFDKYVHTQIKP